MLYFITAGIKDKATRLQYYTLVWKYVLHWKRLRKQDNFGIKCEYIEIKIGSPHMISRDQDKTSKAIVTRIGTFCFAACWWSIRNATACGNLSKVDI